MTGNDRKKPENKMFTLFLPRTSLASARRQVAALRREFDRVLPALRIRIAANSVVQEFEEATPEKPAPDPVDCVQIMSGAGFRPESWNPLHSYIEHCLRYRRTPKYGEIIARLNLPRKLTSRLASIQNPAPAN